MKRWPEFATVARWGYWSVAMSRPAFLVGTVPLYFVGVASAYRAGYQLDASTAIVGLATVWAVQAMTHYNNEYWDVETDRAVEIPTRISGGSRVLTERTVPRRIARTLAFFSMTVAVGLAVATVSVSGAGSLFLGIVLAVILCGWLYSSPPVRLVGRGAGEVVVAGVTGGLVPAVGYLLQTSTIDATLAFVTLPLVPLAFATAIATALPDVSADRETDKRTLPVALGPSRAVILAGAALFLGWLLFGHVATAMMPTTGAVAAAVILLPLGVFAMTAPGSMEGSTGDAERLALAVIATLGSASVSLCALQIVG